MFFRAKKLTPIDPSTLAKLGQGVVNLSKYTEDEFGQVAKAFQQLDPEVILYSAPPKPRRGTIAYADGTHWNPGQGEGPYYYNGTAWIPLFQYSFPVTFPNLSPITNSLGADVALNNTANYFTGPTVAQGSVGTWFVSGIVTLVDTAGAAFFDAKLWDGTTVIASGASNNNGVAGAVVAISLSGYFIAPASNLRISARDVSSASGKILFNSSGNSKDSTISAFRIA